MNQRTAVIIRSNPVNPDSRVEKEANSLLKSGYKVIILGWDRSEKYKRNNSYLKLEYGTVKMVRFGILASFGEGVKNLKAFLIFQYRIAQWLILNKRDYEIIHACDFDTAFTSYICSVFLKKVIVFDIFDYLFSSSDKEINIIKKAVVFLQKKIITNSNATIICTEQRKHQIKGSIPKILTVVHNSPPDVYETIKKLDLNDSKIKIVYIGILQDFRMLKELAEVIKSDSKYELHIGGFGKYENYFKEMSIKYNNIIYYGKLTYEETLTLENSCDIMTALYDPNIENHFYAAPNKFYEGLMLGKPLIMVKNTGMSDVVEKNGIGILIDYSVESLTEGLSILVKQKKEWNHMSVTMRELYKKEYSWAEMEKKLIDMYNKL